MIQPLCEASLVLRRALFYTFALFDRRLTNFLIEDINERTGQWTDTEEKLQLVYITKIQVSSKQCHNNSFFLLDGEEWRARFVSAQEANFLFVYSNYIF